MPRKSSPFAVDAARLLLVEYYTSMRTRHTYESIARRTGLSRATVARLAQQVRNALPTVTALERRIAELEQRVDRLEGRASPGGERQGRAA